jgi:membrane complex biogenesis BtpA family protein
VIIGCLHLPPSAGTPGFPGADTALAQLAADLDAIAGVDAVLLENDNDKPHTLVVSEEQFAWLVRVAQFVRPRVRVPLGINVQRIDWRASFAIADAVGFDFVRLDTLVDRVRMQGEDVSLDPQEVMDARPTGVQVYADVHVKHAELVDGRPLADSAWRAIAAGANAVIVTGARTGEPPTVDDLAAARAAGTTLIGSGLDPDNAARLAPHADGAIVGTFLKDGDRVSRDRVATMVEAWRAYASRR